MKVGIMQPYFMPYIGYFQLMALVDKYIIYDDVNYIKRGWSARNNIIVNREKHQFNIKVEGGSQNSLYFQVVVIDDFNKLRKTLEMNYKKAPCYKDTMELMEKIFKYEDRRFNYFIKNSFEVIFEYLGVNTSFLLSSELSNDKQQKGEAKILDICRLVGATEYYNAIGGQTLYDGKRFSDSNIKLFFVSPFFKEYPQMSKKFIPGLSMIDVLMMNSKEQVLSLLKMFSLE
jgi:hypothetical protein